MMHYGARDRTLGGEGMLAIDHAASLGLDGVELNATDWPPNGPLWLAEERERLRRHADELGVRIPSVGFGVLNQGALAGTAEQQARGKSILRQAIVIAHELGATVVMMQHLGANAISTPEKVRQVVDGVGELIPMAVEHGVTLALENTLDAAANIAILDAVASPNLKVYYDICNTWAVGHDVPADIRRLGDRIAQVHFKDRLPGVTAGCDLGVGIVDVNICAEALRAIGYDGWVLLETPAGDDPIASGRRNLDYLKRFI